MSGVGRDRDDIEGWVATQLTGSLLNRSRHAADLARLACFEPPVEADVGRADAVTLAWVALVLEHSDVGVAACVDRLGASLAAQARLISRAIHGAPHTRKSVVVYWRMVARAPAPARVAAVCAAIAALAAAAAGDKAARAALADALAMHARPLIADQPAVLAALDRALAGGDATG